MTSEKKTLINNAAMGERLRSVRRDLGIRIYEMAGASGVCPLAIYEAEMGRGFPPMDYLWHLNMKCHVSIDYLISGWGEPFPLMPEKISGRIAFGESEELIRPILEHMIREESVAIVMNKFYHELMQKAGPLDFVFS